MNNFKRFIPLLIAVIFATASSIGIYKFLQTRESVSIATPAAAAQTASVVIAKHDLLVGHKLTAEDLRIQAWPKEIVTDKYFISKGELIGRTLRANVIGEEPFTESKLLSEGENISDLIPEGKTAVTVPVRSSKTLQRVLGKSTLVDIIAMFDDDSSMNTKVIAHSAYVLSVDNGGASGSERGGSEMEVILLVSSADASRIVYAMNHGTIEMVVSGKHTPVLEVY